MATIDTENRLTADDEKLQWKGCTIDELRYRRALTLVKLEMQKSRLSESFGAVTGKITAARTGITGLLGGRFDGKWKFLNYVVMGYRSMRIAMDLWGIFRRKKR